MLEKARLAPVYVKGLPLQGIPQSRRVVKHEETAISKTDSEEKSQSIDIDAVLKEARTSNASSHKPASSKPAISSKPTIVSTRKIISKPVVESSGTSIRSSRNERSSSAVSTAESQPRKMLKKSEEKKNREDESRRSERIKMKNYLPVQTRARSKSGVKETSLSKHRSHS